MRNKIYPIDINLSCSLKCDGHQVGVDDATLPFYRRILACTLVQVTFVSGHYIQHQLEERGNGNTISTSLGLIKSRLLSIGGGGMHESALSKVPAEDRPPHG